MTELLSGTALTLVAEGAVAAQAPEYVPGLRLKDGDAVVIDNAWWAYITRDTYGVTLQQMAGGRVSRTFSHWDLHQLYFGPARRMRIERRALGGLTPEVARDMDRPLEGFPARDIDTALTRLPYVAAFARLYNAGRVKRTREDFQRVIRIVAWLRRREKMRELAEKQGRNGRPVLRSEVPLERFGWSTVREWFWRWELSGGLLVALVPRHLNKGSDEQKLHPELRRQIHDIVWERWMTLERVPLASVHLELCNRIDRANAKAPDRDAHPHPNIRSVWRWISKNLDEYDICWHREGSQVASERFRHIKRAPVGVHPMHTVQIDYTRLDAFVVDGQGRPISKDGDAESARPWIVVAICTLTRMVVGFHVTMDPPSWESAMACLRHMALPKDLSRVEGIQSPWPCVGMCLVLQLDNEKAFRSRTMLIASGSLGFKLDWGPTGQSRIRGKIERFFRELSHVALAAVPGRSFSNPTKRGDYDSQGLAAFTLAELVRWITIWIADVYHNRPHGGLMGMTPLQKWTATRALGVHVPDSLDDLDAVLALTFERTIQREGIGILGLRFQDKAFDKLRKRHRGKGLTYQVKIDPNDLTVCAVYDDVDERWVYVRCTTPELVEGMTLLEWREACRLNYRMGHTGRSRETMQAAVTLLHEEAARKGVGRERRRMR